MKVKVDEYYVNVIIIYKNIKNIYMRFNNDILYVTCNKYITEKQILNVINNNIKSLAKMINKQKKKEEFDSFYYYLGNKYTVVYNDDIDKIKIDDDIIWAKNKRMLDDFYKSECLRIFNSRINKMVELFNNLPAFDLKIRNMKTRWGVNNRRTNTITLNSELIKKDINLIDYVIIHELCHFLQANHSKKFWSEVELRYPYYKEARKLLNS